MAPVTSLVLPLLTLLSSQASAVKLYAAHFSGSVYVLDATLPSSTSSAASISMSSKASGCGVTPTWMYLEKDSRTMYCFDESWAGSGVLSTYSFPQGASSLTLQASAKTPGNSVHGSLYGGKDGKSFVITSEYSPSTITTYKLPITANSKSLQKLEFKMSAPGPRPDRQDKPHPHSAFTDPSGAFMVVPDLGADLTRIFRIDQSSGMLTSCGNIASLPGDGPRHGVFRSTGSGGSSALKYYSLNEVSSSVGVYDVTYPSSNSTGCLGLSLKQTLSNYGPSVALGNKLVKSAELHISGSFLYASNRNDSSLGFEQDSIATFKIDESDGKLSFVELANSYAYYPRSFAINKAGTYVAVGGQTTANVAILERDTVTGKLGKRVANLQLPPKGTYGGEDGLSFVEWDE
ncbi:Lactonase, 7-bladed beta-propeller-domain-containing protein [Clohesyomyces aquaticus]|uniref:Lactonase, 7-bladed beta-propeller-domain-containing protein n=1 Tax=Clohesyomyces aquaticus TaxID=1231657 RepID=A0A1Y1Z557_9PLEO|nr:Lactonase, 7-bladed beta-propeller-domain-containing protein [Clohesyomyces aquaticus]